jgi:neopullulanase
VKAAIRHSLVLALVALLEALRVALRVALLPLALSAWNAVPVITQANPPNWWAGMPKPLLLLHGEHLSGARFTLSDRRLHIDRLRVSANGHWAELWLENSADAAAGRARIRGWHGGDFRGITQHLDYIQELGFTTVWITPVYANEREPDSYHGYGATDMYAVDPHYGSLADLQALASALHRRHMKLVLDTVPNHVGPKHPWVDDEPDPDWLHGTKADHYDAVGEFRPLVDPHAPWRDQRYILEGWFAGILPDLNQENSATERYLIQNAMWWIEQTGADGLRLDTFPYVGRAFWHDFHAQIHATYPHVTTAGEIFNCDATITSFFAGGAARNGIDTGLDTPFDFPAYCALRDVLLTMRGMPQVYAGDEIAMSGGEDPDNLRDFPGGWPHDAQNAFAERTPQQAAMHDWVQRLLTLRAKYPALQSGAMQVLAADRDKLIVILNRSAAVSTVNFKLDATLLAGTARPHTVLGDAVAHWESDDIHVEMPGSSVWIALIQEGRSPL